MRQQTLLKIVGLMRTDLDKGSTILGISKKLKIGYRPAYNHIISMGKEGIIKIEVVGNAKLCSLNLNNPKCRHLLEELDSLKKEEVYAKYPRIKPVIESLLSRVTSAHISEIHSVVLFGSYAKGTATKTSDIDLLFIVTDLKNKQLREGIERESASYQYSYNLKVSQLITDINEFKKMLKAEEFNVGKETRKYGISLYGSEMFWRLVS
ncbi:MAG TPA: nucleotidyltransferase domain-containing protein [archaeon]|nr:nucleotidyltransferase domain-containing protein [archaeon]